MFKIGSGQNYVCSIGQCQNNNNKILSFWVGTSKNNNGHQVKETCAIMSTQVTCETEHISLLVIQKCQVH